MVYRAAPAEWSSGEVSQKTTPSSAASVGFLQGGSTPCPWIQGTHYSLPHSPSSWPHHSPLEPPEASWAVIMAPGGPAQMPFPSQLGSPHPGTRSAGCLQTPPFSVPIPLSISVSITFEFSLPSTYQISIAPACLCHCHPCLCAACSLGPTGPPLQQL